MDDQWMMPPANLKVRAEYDSVGSVRFMDPENIKMLDSEGNEVKCKKINL